MERNPHHYIKIQPSERCRKMHHVTSVRSSRAAVLAAAATFIGLIGTQVAFAADTVVHGKVLSTNVAAKSFRIRVTETGKEKGVVTRPATILVTSTGKRCKFGDIKVGRAVEVRSHESVKDALVATRVTVRL